MLGCNKKKTDLVLRQGQGGPDKILTLELK